jgi:hypothetical protein
MAKTMADHIKIKESHEGLLHKELGVKIGMPISLAKEEAAMKHAGPAERKRLQFAINFHKGGK